MRRRDALAALVSLGAAAGIGGCERPREQAKVEQPTHRVGLLLTGLSDAATQSQRRVIVETLGQHGFVEGQNLAVELRRGGYSPTEDREVIRPLIASRPDVILVDSTPFALRTREATDSIPIVFTGVADPVGAGLIKDFAHPGGNATGVHFFQAEIGAKRLELLRELLPEARRVMVARYLPSGETDTLPHLRAIASRLGLELVEIGVGWAGFPTAHAQSVYGTPDAMYNGEPWMFSGGEHVVDQLIAFAASERIPSLFWEAAAAERGATLAYGVNVARELGRAAGQVARILKGAKPADLAVDVSTDYELVVNRKAAAAIGIAIPGSILARANRVIA